VPLNVTEQLKVTQEFMKEMAQNEIGVFLAEISKVYFLFNKTVAGCNHIYLHDPAAIFAVIMPDIFTEFMTVFLDVETKGEFTTGMTLADLRQNPSQKKGKKY